MKISVVIPIYNEQENLPALTSRLVAVLEKMGAYEILYVDDGSRDSSPLLIAKYCQENQNIKYLQFTRNFGHQAAISAGIHFASGDAVIVMDGDLQDPPEVLPEFVAKWKEGYEVVYAIRKKRKENIFKRFAYFAFYRLLAFLSPIKIPLDSGDFGLMDRKVVNALNSLPEKTRFVRGIRSWVGFKQTGLEYERQARFAGKPKFTLRKLIKLAYDGLISFTHLPLKAASIAGVFFTGVAALGILYIFYLKLIEDIEVIQGWASTFTLILFVTGIQLLITGIQGEYIARIFDEVKNRPQFLVGHSLNINAKQNVEPLKKAA